MTTFETIGHTALQLYDAELVLARRLRNGLRSLLREQASDGSLSGASFTELEPDLAKESRPR